MKYDNWRVNSYDSLIYNDMLSAGISPLLASVLCAHDFDGPESALSFIDSDDMSLHDPMLLNDMDKAARRVRQAIAKDEHIAVYGDYDVDGITSTCLLVDFFKSLGAEPEIYIPGRIEQGYGLNIPAIDYLHSLGVNLIITVDCGITAIEETEYANSLGIDLVITDHHECRDTLPSAVAVVNPHRHDSTYPFTSLAGVGVAFKLACAVAGKEFEKDIFDRYADLVCLGTVADVMPLLGENRIFVRHGIKRLHNSRRPGIRALIRESGADGKGITVSTVGYILAPRINAAGRMEQVEVAVNLLTASDDASAEKYASTLCAMNRERQAIEARIYQEAVDMLTERPQEHIITLCSESWHAGVVGIVASRLSEEYRCPTVLICIDGEKGKASSRSFGDFNLFAALEKLSDMLCSYGGHALAAGFTVEVDRIEEFSESLRELARQYFEENPASASLELDCEIPTLSLMSIDNVLDLDRLEPCGAGFPRPLFYMNDLLIEQLSEVGGGRHIKMRLSKGAHEIGGIMFSSTMAQADVCEGDTAQLAFCPQINEFRGNRSVQLLVTDIRPDEATRVSMEKGLELYSRFCSGDDLSDDIVKDILPVRDDFVSVWRFLKSNANIKNYVDGNIGCLSRKITRSGSRDIGAGMLMICLDVFFEHGLISYDISRDNVHIDIIDNKQKVNLADSKILAKLRSNN